MEALIKHDREVLMLKDGSGRTVLHLACQNGHLNVVKLIEFYFDPEELKKMYELCDSEGNTLLHLACQYQKKNVVLHLVKKGRANIDARNFKNEEAPIHVAAQFQSTEIIDILLEEGADLEARDGNSCTPLHYAAGHNQKGMIQHLLR